MLSDAQLHHASLLELDRMLVKAMRTRRLHTVSEAGALLGMALCWFFGMLTTPAVVVFLFFKVTPHTTALQVAQGLGIVLVTILALGCSMGRLHRIFRNAHDIAASLGCWANVEVDQIETAMSMRADERLALDEATALRASSLPAGDSANRSSPRI